MNAHDDVIELAELYVSGAGTELETAAFEALLAAGEPIAVQTLRELSPAIGALIDSTPPHEPPPRVKERLMATAEMVGGMSDWVLLRESFGHWSETGVSGVQLKTLYLDRSRNVHTFLMRCAAGSKIPVHAHHEAEECYVVQGELHTFGTVLREGDYLRAAAGSTHPESHTERGCVLLVTAAIGDEEEHAQS
ncbi:MAG: cupin domain-containing protein [Phycisphaerae bacterium]